MRLQLPEGFPTEVHVLVAPDPDLLPAGRWVLVADEALRPSWTAARMPVPEGSLFFSPSEATKSLDSLLPWLSHWAALPLHRDATVVALGGGILTDMAGLASALYLRGIPWQAWPTTLLAQVDAGLGGKTGVNLPEGKNLVGAFHPPQRFVACRAFLDTLPIRQLHAGRWEMVKMALLEGDATWAQALLLADLPDIQSLERALRLKAEEVHRDPFEQGERRLLNLGHTLGHALESASHYSLLHGEAVGLGLLAACFLAEAEGEPAFPEALRNALAGALAPLLPRVPAWEACLPWVTRDKKAFQPQGRLPPSHLPPGHDPHSRRHEGAIHCILPRPGLRAVQKALPVSAWADAHARLLRSLN